MALTITDIDIDIDNDNHIIQISCFQYWHNQNNAQ